MPRPNKRGLDYYSLDTDIENDDKILLIEAKHGITGFGVLLKLFSKIYKAEGYYCSWGESESFLFAKRINVDINSVNAIINDCLYCEKKFRIFDTEMYETLGILTSRGIQRRYLAACERRKSVEISRTHLLLSLQEINEYKNLVIVDINEVNVDINSVNANNVSTGCKHDVDISTQSKVKKSKVNKKENLKEKKSYAEFVTMTEDEYKKLIEQYGEAFTGECITKLDNHKGASGKTYKSDYRAILTWVVDTVKEKRAKEAANGKFGDNTGSDSSMFSDDKLYDKPAVATSDDGFI